MSLSHNLQDSPYLQYFIGMSSYINEAPFDSSMLVHFRERISAELVNKVNQETVKRMLEITSSTLATESTESTESTQKKTKESEKEDNTPKNRGKLILDATCAPADISYPTDLEPLSYLTYSPECASLRDAARTLNSGDSRLKQQ